MAHHRRAHPEVLDDIDFYTQFGTHILTLAGLVGVVGWATGVNGALMARTARIWRGRGTTNDEEALRRDLRVAEAGQDGIASRFAQALIELAYRFAPRSRGAQRVARAISPERPLSRGSENPDPAAGERTAMRELQRAEGELRAAEAAAEAAIAERRRLQEEERRREQARSGNQPASQNLPIRPGTSAGPSNPRPSSSREPIRPDICRCGKHYIDPKSGRARLCRKCSKQ